MVTKINIKEKDKVNIYFIGDIHAGSVTCQKNELRKTINLIKKDPRARVVLMGDYGEYITETDTRRYDLNCVDPKLDTPHKQTDYIYKLLNPIKDKIYGVLRGNHEATFAKYNKEEYEDTDFLDEADFLACGLDVRYLGDLGIIELKINKQIYNIVVTHGIGCSTKLSGQLAALNKIIDNFDTVPDLVAMGHVHSLQTIVNPKLNFNFETKIKHLALTGSYFKTYIEGNINYASSNLYGTLPIGCVMYSFDNKGNIKDNKIIF